MKKPLILGHRGARAVCLENTLDGFYYTKSLIRANHLGIDGVEFDIQLTKDKSFAVFHDDDLKRLAHAQSRLDELSFRELSRHLIFDKTHRSHAIPPLSAMPAALDGYQHIELEIKTHARTDHQALVRALMTVLPSFYHLPVVLTSFDAKILEWLNALQTKHKHLNPSHHTFKTGLLIEQPFDHHTLIHTAKRLQVSQIGCHYPLIDKHLINLCHRYDLALTAWTVNDVAIATRLAHDGVDTIISDDPAMMINALKPK